MKLNDKIHFLYDVCRIPVQALEKAYLMKAYGNILMEIKKRAVLKRSDSKAFDAKNL